MFKYNGILHCEKWYKHQPEPIIEAKVTSLLWYFVIQTDRKIKSNWADIGVKDYTFSSSKWE